MKNERASVQRHLDAGVADLVLEFGLRKTLSIYFDTESIMHNLYPFIAMIAERSNETKHFASLQDAILRLVSRECVAGEGECGGNLFTVGDVKQFLAREGVAVRLPEVVANL